MGRVLVTGGAGFIGSHVADRFIAAGHDVTVIDSLVTGKRAQVPSQATFHELDIRSPEAQQVVREGGFDLVAHLAAQIDVRISVDDPARDASVNILGTLNLLEGARNATGGRRPRFIIASTGGALYGDFVTPPNVEDYPKDPDAPYGIGKLSAELYMSYYGRIHGMECVALRFGNVYGPRQDPHGEAGVIAIFCGRIQAGRALTIFGDGSQTRDYIYVGDVADAFVTAAAATLPAPGRLDVRGFNIGTGIETSVVELAEQLRRAAGTDVPIEFAPRRAGELQRSVLDPRKAERVLGWKARVSLEEGLRETYRWATGATATPAVATK
jgi:UDP-glucose 4-epimerase